MSRDNPDEPLVLMGGDWYEAVSMDPNMHGGVHYGIAITRINAVPTSGVLFRNALLGRDAEDIRLPPKQYGL